MKKLLALLLCLALLVGAVPFTAFADGPDLSPVYAAMDKLGQAYGSLAGAIVGANAVDGLNALFKQLFMGVTYHVGGATINFYSDSTYPNVFDDPYVRLMHVGTGIRLGEQYGMSYEALFELAVQEGLIAGYNYIGSAVEASCIYATQEFTENMEKTVADYVASMTAMLPKT